jgi:hypothetical protein
MKKLSALLLFSLPFFCSYATIRHVGPSQAYATLSQAAAAVNPGDTILFHAGIYSGGQYCADLHGTAGSPITLMALPGDTVVHVGGTNGWHLSEVSYLNIYNLVFEQQTGNGFNLDDAGTISTPAHHIVFENCVFRNMNASGNNDLLKLSGLDTFEIRNCRFLNGATGGSGIDMVGCHRGSILGCHFENMGSNAIQAKGGTQFVRIEANSFKNCGERSVNLGGSTGLSFFRPLDAKFEASDLQVYSNVFIGSVAPIAYVGCQKVDVVNNTIYMPGKWVLRILQETVDTTRFVKCGNNAFRNNIIYHGNAVTTDCNIGPNTDPASFRFSNNLWFHYQNSSWTGPTGLPVTDSNNITGSDPLFANASGENFTISISSPATGKGFTLVHPIYDHAGNTFASPRAIGAYESNISNHITPATELSVLVFPNPFTNQFSVQVSNNSVSELILYDMSSRRIFKRSFVNSISISTEHLAKGIYLYEVRSKNGGIMKGKVVKD